MAYRDENEYVERRNRSAMKREAKAIEGLARELAEMEEARFSRLVLDGELYREILQARQTRGHGSRKRQIKHLAALLRRDEEACAQLQAFVDGEGEDHWEEVSQLHQLEGWRDRLCEPESTADALKEIKAAFPLADWSGLPPLIRRVQAGNDRTAYRKIFKLLKEVLESTENS